MQKNVYNGKRIVKPARPDTSKDKLSEEYTSTRESDTSNGKLGQVIVIPRVDRPYVEIIQAL